MEDSGPRLAQMLISASGSPAGKGGFSKTAFCIPNLKPTVKNPLFCIGFATVVQICAHPGLLPQTATVGPRRRGWRDGPGRCGARGPKSFKIWARMPRNQKCGISAILSTISPDWRPILSILSNISKNNPRTTPYFRTCECPHALVRFGNQSSQNAASLYEDLAGFVSCLLDLRL